MILALDPSTKTIGWAVLDDDICRGYGVFHYTQVGIEEKCLEAYRWLEDSIAVSGLYDAIALEIPVMHGNPRKSNVATTRTLGYISGALRTVAARYLCPIIDVLPSQRLLAVGLPITMKSADAKREVRRLVNQIFGLDLKPKEHDISDAIAVGLFAQRVLKEQGWLLQEAGLS